MARTRETDGHGTGHKAGRMLLIEEHLHVVAAVIRNTDIGKEQGLKIEIPVIQLMVGIAGHDHTALVEPHTLFQNVTDHIIEALFETRRCTFFMPVFRQQIQNLHDILLIVSSGDSYAAPQADFIKV